MPDVTGRFTAWLTTDRTCLDTDFCDLAVLEDQVIGERGDGTPYWESTGEPVLTWTTTVRADADDTGPALRDAKHFLESNGWETVGEWEGITTGSVIEVRRQGGTDG